MNGSIVAVALHRELPERILQEVPVPTSVLHHVSLTGSTAFLHFADKDTQPMLRAPTDTEAQLAIHTFLHCDGIDDIALVAASCGDRVQEVLYRLGATASC